MRKICVWIFATLLGGIDRMSAALGDFFQAVDDAQNRSAHAAGRHLTYVTGCVGCETKKASQKLEQQYLKDFMARRDRDLQVQLDAQKETRAESIPQ